MKAFTLIEMLMVMLLLGVLTMMGMYFSNGQLIGIQEKTVKENFLSQYQYYYGKVLSSSYYLWEKYLTWEFILNSGSNQLSFSFLTWENWWIEESREFSISWSDLWWSIQHLSLSSSPSQELESLSLLLTPYQVGCVFSWDKNILTWKVTFDLWFNDVSNHLENNKKYCFEISSETCRIREISCQSKDE